MKTAFFYLTSFGAIASAIGVVRSRSAVYSVLWLVLAMCFTAGLFILQQAFLVAAIQILVYAGAILVLFLFIVMLLDIKTAPEAQTGWHARAALSFGIAAAAFLQILLVIGALPVSRDLRIQGVTEAVGGLLFSRFVLPFELTSFLLLAAIISIVVLAKKDAP